MQPEIAVGETKPGDVMERPFVTLPFAQWETLEAAEQRVAALTVRLEQEKALSGRITQEFQAYMREHQMLTTLQKAGK